MADTGRDDSAAAGFGRVDALMARYVAEGRSAGMLALVSRRGKVEYLACHGHADIAAGRPIREDTIFRIFSMTKPITSVALMTLFEQGRFDLDDAAKRYLPKLAALVVDGGEPLARDITFRHLLTHTAGFSYGFDPQNIPVDARYAEVWRDQPQSRSVAEILDVLLELPLIAQPGTRWHYSIATDICGYLVELISDMPFVDYLRRKILDPLNMRDTAFTVAERDVERFATLYGYTDEDPLAQLESADGSPFVPSRSGLPVRFDSGGGGLVSTARDYWRFAQMMLNRGELDGIRILRPETVDSMTRNHLDPALLPIAFNGVAPEPSPAYGFGLGYCVNLDPAAAPARGSQGDFGWGGLADTYCWVDPREELVAILLQQFMPSLHHPGRREFRDAVYASLE